MLVFIMNIKMCVCVHVHWRTLFHMPIITKLWLNIVSVLKGHKLHHPLPLPPPAERRKHQGLTFTCQEASRQIPDTVPSDNYFIPLENKKQIRPKRSEDVQTTNLVDQSRRKSTHCYDVETTKIAIFRNCFFSWPVVVWNNLEDSTVCSSILHCAITYKIKRQF